MLEIELGFKDKHFLVVSFLRLTWLGWNSKQPSQVQKPKSEIYLRSRDRGPQDG